MPDAPTPRNTLEKFFSTVANVIESPVVWVREKIVLPNQQTYPWYHQKFRRVPTVDECYTDDLACKFEADEQFRRDRQVDNAILTILRDRFEDCVMYEKPDHEEKCMPLWHQYQEASTNWFIKYGDLGFYGDAAAAYMKQKHRMIWERRHGPVGSGMKKKEEEAE